jgi:hypothetical protein
LKKIKIKKKEAIGEINGKIGEMKKLDLKMAFCQL